MDISIKTTRDIHDLKEDWMRLDDLAMASIAKGEIRYVDYTFYQTYIWNHFLYNAYNHAFTHTEYIAAAYKGEVKMILPLLIDSFNKRLRILNGRISGICNIVCPYKDATAREMMQSVVNYLKDNYCKGWKYKFRDIPAGALFADALISNGAIFKEKPSYNVPVKTFESYEHYLSSLGKNIYKNIRKAYNHLSTDGKTLSLQCYSNDNPPPIKLLKELWRIYFRRKMAWNNQHSTWIRKILNKVKALRMSYIGKETKSILQLKESELYVLKIDEKIAAFMHTYVHNNHVIMPKLAIDTSLSRYSPGILLIQEAMKLFIERKIIDFDLCRGDERYKIEVGGINVPLIGCTIS